MIVLGTFALVGPKGVLRLAARALTGLYLLALVLGAFVSLPFALPGVAVSPAELSPLFQSLVAGFLILFLLAGIAYGRAAGSIENHRDVVKMMSGAMSDLAYYLVLAFAAAHFVAMFNWSNLGLIFAAQGAAAVENSGLPPSALLALLVVLGGRFDWLVEVNSCRVVAPVSATSKRALARP
jgi:aminobenzoyl-glutamate transport protein